MLQPSFVIVTINFLLIIQSIDVEQRGRVAQCFTALLNEWLQGEPQVKDLLKSLRGPVVDRPDLADDLESKIEVGELEWKD